MNRIIRLFTLFFLFTLLAGCEAGSGGNLAPTPPVPVFGDFVLNVAAVSPAGNTTNGSLAARALSGGFKSFVALSDGGIRIEETRNNIEDISFEGDNQQGDKVEFPGRFVVLLVRQGSIVNLEFPDFSTADLPFDSYHAFEMRISRLVSDNIPSELLDDPLVTDVMEDQSFLVEGSFLESGDNDIDGNGSVNFIPFRIVSDNEVQVRVSSPNPFVVSPDKVNFFFIAVQLQAWFEELLPMLQQLTAADLTGGTAVISDSHPDGMVRDILDRFELNTEKSLKIAPSEDGEFDEADIDEASESGGSVEEISGEGI